MIWRPALVASLTAQSERKIGERPPQGQKRAQATPDAAASKRRRVMRTAMTDTNPSAILPASSLGGLTEFRRAWINLRKERWSSQPPQPGLDNLDRYIKPDRGAEGDGYLLGEEAVLAFIGTSLVAGTVTNAQPPGYCGTQERHVYDKQQLTMLEGVAEIKGVVEAVAMRASSVMCLAR
ncbi:hypothetical protein GQ600_9087 [Phytophthora cactorum]|nr:hypothetical protein GQ600_9087 [Phytophthora cactorum]